MKKLCAPKQIFSQATILAGENQIFFAQVLLEKTIKKKRPFLRGCTKMDAEINYVHRRRIKIRGLNRGSFIFCKFVEAVAAVAESALPA